MKKSIRNLAAAGLAAVLPAVAFAAEENKNKSKSDVEEKVEVLADEVRKLKLQKETDLKEGKSYTGLGPAASKVYFSDQGLSIGGYGELKYSHYLAQKTNNVNSSNYKQNLLDAHRFIIYTGYKWTDSIILNSEIEIEHADEIFLEFANVDFLLTDAFNIRAGLLLVPMGLVNEYHEPTVFRGVNRPDIEKNIIPSTWRDLGVMSYGELPFRFEYKLGIAGGLDAEGFNDSSWIRGGRTKGSQTNADELAGFARLDYRQPWLLIGASGYRGGANLDPAGFARNSKYHDARDDITVTLLDSHLELQYKGLLIRALGVAGRLDGVATVNRLTGENVGQDVFGWYGEVGYDLWPLFAKTPRSLIPFVRFEKYNLHEGVGGESGPKDKHLEQTRLTTGIDFKPIQTVVLKADFQMNTAEKRKSDPAGLELDKKRVNLALGFIF